VSTLLTIGTWDLPHVGHATFLRRCERFADEVVVGVNSDAFVAAYRGKPSLFSFEERCILIGGLGYRCLENDGPGRELILRTWPQVLAIGSDWARKDYHAQIDITQDELDERGIALLFLPYTQGISSTELKARCRT